MKNRRALCFIIILLRATHVELKISKNWISFPNERLPLIKEIFSLNASCFLDQRFACDESVDRNEHSSRQFVRNVTIWPRETSIIQRFLRNIIACDLHHRDIKSNSDIFLVFITSFSAISYQYSDGERSENTIDITNVFISVIDIA